MIEFFTHAKVNLCLDITGKDASGLHKIQTVFYELRNLKDTLKIFGKKDNDKVSILNRGKKTEFLREDGGHGTQFFKAIDLIKNEFRVDEGVYIEITKNIPFSSGLGGVSGNLAGILKGLNLLFGLALSEKKLREVAILLGMDVPYFISGKTALGTNYGEVITPLPEIEGLEIAVNKKKFWGKTNVGSTSENKTKNMYESIDSYEVGKNTHLTKACVDAIRQGDLSGVIKNLHNDFEKLYEIPKGTHLSGAGPATFTFASELASSI